MHREHRRRYLDALRRQDACAVVVTATEKLRNADTDFRYRPDSDFWYLTGFAEPGAALVLLPGRPDAADEAARHDRSLLFLRRRDREREVWTGRRLGVERAPQVLGVDEARPIEELWDALPSLLRGYARIDYRAGVDEQRDRDMLGVFTRLRTTAGRKYAPPKELCDPAERLHELRLKKGAAELELMRRGAEITREAHVAAMRSARPGMGEHELDALLQYTFRRHGASGEAYPNIVASGANACILHYVENSDVLREGELLLIDAGAEYGYYATDVTRTFPIGGRFSGEQRAIYELVLDAQLAAIEAVRPGSTPEAVHEAALHKLAHGLLELGLLKGSFDEVIEKELYRAFYMHGTGHWLGLDVHDVGLYRVDGASRPLEPGMVTTVEPGLYIAPDDDTVEERWRGIGVRIEDDVLVTADGHENLTASIPKCVEELEEVCSEAELAPMP